MRFDKGFFVDFPRNAERLNVKFELGDMHTLVTNEVEGGGFDWFVIEREPVIFVVLVKANGRDKFVEVTGKNILLAGGRGNEVIAVIVVKTGVGSVKGNLGEIIDMVIR